MGNAYKNMGVIYNTEGMAINNNDLRQLISNLCSTPSGAQLSLSIILALGATDFKQRPTEEVSIKDRFHNRCIVVGQSSSRFGFFYEGS